MSQAASAVYSLKRHVIHAAIQAGMCEVRTIEVETSCKTCEGTGLFKRWHRYNYDDDYDLEDCRRCGASGRAKLQFAETTIEGIRWHTPRKTADFIADQSAWSRCEASDWRPNQIGAAMDRMILIAALDRAEEIILEGRMIPWAGFIWDSNPLRYSLDLGEIKACWLCGQQNERCHPFRIHRPGLVWSQALCTPCEAYAQMQPRQWPANLKREYDREWRDDYPHWNARCPLPDMVHRQPVSRWLRRRGIVIGAIPPGEYGYITACGPFVQVLAVRDNRARVKICEHPHPLYDRDVTIPADVLRGHPWRLLEAPSV